MPIFILISLLLWSLPSDGLKAMPFSDQPWDQRELDRRLNENLVLNGDLSQSFSHTARRLPEDVAPCWYHYHIPETYRVGEDNLLINHRAPALISVRAIQYYFRGDEPSYNVSLRGDFTPSAQVSISAELCGANCRLQSIQMNKVGPNLFEGRMLPGREGEYVERFHLAASVGSISIDSFVVSNADEPNAASIQERDASIMGMCYEEVSPMIGDVRAIHLAGIALANITAFGVIFWLLRRKSFFPAFLVCSFFLTNVLGLLPLYFGWSEVRVTQHVLDRAIVATLAWAGLAMLCLAVCGYCAASWIWSKFWCDRCCRIEVNFWTVLSIFVMIACVVLASSLPKAIEYYQAAGGGGIGASARAAFLRSLINQETFGLKSHYFRLFFLLLPLVLNFIILSKAIDRNVFLIVPILIGIQVAILLYNGEKAPVAWYLFALGYLALAKGLFRKEFIWPAFGVGAALLIVVLAGPQSMRLMADRMILGGLTVGYYVIKIFPEESPFLAGSSLRLLGMGSDVRFNLDLFMWRNIFSDSYFSHLSGTATGAVWVQGYANFGWIGAGVFAAAFGAIVASAQALVTRLFVPSVAAGVGSLLIFHYSSLGESNLDRFLTDFYLVGVVTIVLLIAVASYVLESVSRHVYVSR